MAELKRFLGQYRSEASRLKRRHTKSMLRYYFRYLPKSLSAQLGLSSGVSTKYGVRLSPNIFDATFRLYCEGSYGTFFSNYLVNYNEPFQLIDIGANQGLYSLLAAQNTNCIEAVAFEPVSTTFKLLKKNISLNGTSSRITPINAAISDQAGIATLFQKRVHSGGAALNQTMVHTGKKSETIQTIAAQELNNLITKDAPILIKLNGEGHEETVLKELIRTAFFPRIQSILYEVDERAPDLDLLRNILKAQGFKKFEKVQQQTRHDVLASRT